MIEVVEHAARSQRSRRGFDITVGRWSFWADAAEEDRADRQEIDGSVLA
jgi:thiamine biosynthesis lipoprotein ApbE